MAMFDKHKNRQPGKTAEPAVSKQPPGMGGAQPEAATNVAMIGNGVRIAGEVVADTDLKVEGFIQGRAIESSKSVEIGEHGRVEAVIKAKVVKVGGELKGDVFGTEKVMITKTGRMQGNIVAPRVQLEDGALFRGSIEMNPAPAVAAKPTENRSAKPEAGASAPRATSSQATPSGGTRKEPGLTLKSG
jgi:cytoskeletal protein CcmA (bactofilin family)